MSGPGHEDFEARIRRIEEKRGITSEPPVKSARGQDVSTSEGQAKSQKTIKPQSGNKRAIALIVLILAFVGGGFAFTQLGSGTKTPQQAADSSTKTTQKADAGGASILAAARNLLSKGSLNAKTSEEDPEPVAVRTLTDQGWVIEGPGVATADRADLALADIAQASATPPAEPLSLDLVAFDVNESCEVQKPEDGEVIHNVRLGHGTAETDVHVLSNAQMAEALIKHITGVTARNKPYLVGSMAEHPMASVDVIVTDTSGPIYLVLQGFNADTIWNLQLADGVELAHVVMIGENSGLAGLPEGATFEALRISDFVTNFEFGSNDEIVPCMIAPWRTPEPHWPAYQKAQNDNMLFENQMYSYNAGARAFGEWYSQALGRDASENLVSVKGAAHVLAGPMPNSPVTLSPLAGRSIQITRNDRILRGYDVLKKAHEELLAAAVGGDLSLLNPDPMEVTQQ